MSFDPNQMRGQPANKGSWVANANGEPESPLPPVQRELPDHAPGARVTYGGVNGSVVSTDNGTHMVKLDNGDLTLASRRDLGLDAGRKPQTGIEAIQHIDVQLRSHTSAEDKAVAEIHGSINEGAYGHIRDVALFDIRLIETYEANLASKAGIDSSDQALVNPRRGAAEDLYATAWSNTDHDTDSDNRYVAMSAAQDAALALTYRDYISNPRWPRFDQEAYDHLVRPWATVHGPVHSDDDPQPKSWKKRPDGRPKPRKAYWDDDV